jgi:small-conductance mechanosensitive channel
MLLAALLATAGFGGALAQTIAPEGPASAPAPAASALLNVADTVAQIAASTELQRAALARIEQVQPWHELAQRTTALQADFDRLELDRADRAELVELLGLEHRAWALEGSASAIVDKLASILRSLERDRSALETEAGLWQERRSFLREYQVPEAVLDRARGVEAGLQAAGDRVRKVRDSALLDLVNALTLQARTVEAGARIGARLEQVRAHRMELETASLWRLDRSPAQFGLVAVELGKAARTLREYLAEHGGRLAAAFFGLLGLSWWLFTRRPGQDLGPAQHAYGRPVAAATLVALMLSVWWAPAAPMAFYMLLLLLTPLPAAMLARRSFAAAIPLSLYGLAFATVLLALRNAVEASPIADRALLLLQTLSLGVPVAIDLQRGRLQQALVRFSPGTVRLVALIVIAASAATVLQVFIGFSGPTRSLRAGAGSVMGYGLVFGATALALYGLTLALLARPPLCWLHSARAADPALLRALRLALGVAALGGVAIVTLGNLRLTAATLSAVDSLLDSTVVVGAVSLPATAIAAAAGIALGTLVLSAVTEFVLDREVFPRLRLRPGAGYAIATFTRWVILIAGTLLALAALGIDTTKLTLVAGALSVGIGFGLQHVVNNFVSGLILIIERPVSVGDLVEIGPLIGEIKRIGMRSSSVRTTHGAEVIVPNSDLASKEVINWTRSDRQRRYNIDVGVAYGSDPVRVMRLLEEAAREVPEVMSEPAPMAMFQGFGDSSLDFRLLAWVSTIDLGPQAQTALRIAVLRKLEAAGIEIPFPQRDVHLVAPPAPATPPKALATEPR